MGRKKNLEKKRATTSYRKKNVLGKNFLGGPRFFGEDFFKLENEKKFFRKVCGPLFF